MKKALVAMGFSAIGISTLYGVAYLIEFYKGLWWANPTITLGIFTIAASILGIMYTFLEMK